MASQLELQQRPFIELQIEALVEENRIKPKRVGKFIDKLEARILAIKTTNYEKLLSRAFRLPLIGRPNSLNDDYPDKFRFHPPKQVDVVGSFKTSTALKRIRLVDIAVCMPAECFTRKDVKNQKYQHKRALYLAQLAHLISCKDDDKLIDKLEYRYHMGDFLKPVLLITPADERLQQYVKFQLFVYPEQDCGLKPSLLQPDHGNVSPSWFFKDYTFPYDVENNANDPSIAEFLKSDSESAVSPYYNSSILFDMELAANSDTINDQVTDRNSLIESLILIKVWLYQRELHKHFTFVLSMFVAYLQTKRTIHQNMSSYQIFKVIIKSIAESDWSDAGLSFYDDARDKIPTFKQFFPVIFLSPSGNLNMCYNIPIDLYDRLKHEARLSQVVLCTNATNTFDQLFLKRVEFLSKFDVIVHLPKCTKKLPLELSYLRKYMDYGVFLPNLHSDTILNLAKRSLTDRVQLVQQSQEHLLLDMPWNTKSIPLEPRKADITFTFGLLLDAEKSIRTMDIGPAADSAQAAEFKEFWEPKSQLRLQNGIISETVSWHVSEFSQRRSIIKYILTHALKKADIHKVIVHYTLLERLVSLQNVRFKWADDQSASQDAQSNMKENGKRKASDDKCDIKPVGVGEEIFQRALNAYNELTKAIRAVECTNHLVTGIQPISNHLRASAVYPPLPVCLQQKNKSLKRAKGVTLFPQDFKVAGKIMHIEPIEVLVTLDSTGKWPNDLEAFQAAKIDFLIQMGEDLRAKEYCVKFAEDYLDIMHGQFVFRIRVKCGKELILLATRSSKENLQRRRFELDVLPRAHSSLDQLYREKPAFGVTCRVVKRWLACQLMTDHIDDVTADLLVAHVFLHPQPYTEPASSFCGFKRLLALIARHDWAELPLIVNFDDALKEDEMQRLKDDMSKNRAKFPSMVVCTPFDKEASPWTRAAPSDKTLATIRKLCQKALEFIDNKILTRLDVGDELLSLFRPNFKMFDLLIKVHEHVVQNFYMSIQPPKNFELIGCEPASSRGKQRSALKVMPIVGLNMIEQYVKLLRRDFDQVATFHYDKHGQRVIGVVLRDAAQLHLNSDNLSKFIRGIKELGTKMVDTVVVVK